MDVSSIRNDFPVLSKRINGKFPIFLDSACTTLRPVQVIDAMNEYYTSYPSCGGRSLHKFGTRVTMKCDEARRKIQKFLNAERPEEIIFTKNTTEAINLIAWTMDFEKDDVILTTDKEHNSNLVPWLILTERKGTKHQVVFSKEDNTFSMESLKEALSEKVKLVSMVHTSNLDGYTIPAKDIAEVVHDSGALLMLDGAQSTAHMKIDVKDLDVDFFAFSVHKTCGPSGMGVLYGKYDLLEKLNPFITGGDTVSDSRYDRCVILAPPHKFEGGLQNYGSIIGAGAAVDYLSKIGMDNVREHTTRLNRMASRALMDVPGVSILGPEASKRGPILPFNIEGVESHDVAMILDEVANVMIRSGTHCVHSWFNAHGIRGSARASFFIYNNEREVKIFCDEVSKIASQFS